VKVFDVPWNEIPMRDWPKTGEVCICRATGQEVQVVGKEGYSVTVMGDGSLKGNLVRLGLFWTKRMALVAANAIHKVPEKTEEPANEIDPGFQVPWEDPLPKLLIAALRGVYSGEAVTVSNRARDAVDLTTVLFH